MKKTSVKYCPFVTSYCFSKKIKNREIIKDIIDEVKRSEVIIFENGKRPERITVITNSSQN